MDDCLPSPDCAHAFLLQSRLKDDSSSQMCTETKQRDSIPLFVDINWVLCKDRSRVKKKKVPYKQYWRLKEIENYSLNSGEQ
jgi:hypothetical protein